MKIMSPTYESAGKPTISEVLDCSKIECYIVAICCLLQHIDLVQLVISGHTAETDLMLCLFILGLCVVNDSSIISLSSKHEATDSL